MADVIEPWQVLDTCLRVELQHDRVEVECTLTVRSVGGAAVPLVLDGRGLVTHSIEIDGAPADERATLAERTLERTPRQSAVETAVAAGDYHTVALTGSGTVWGWGDNSFGELGTSPNLAGSSSTPLQVTPLSSIAAIAAGGGTTVALGTDVPKLEGILRETALGNPRVLRVPMPMSTKSKTYPKATRSTRFPIAPPIKSATATVSTTTARSSQIG